jgi:hypothetical protein
MKTKCVLAYYFILVNLILASILPGSYKLNGTLADLMTSKPLPNVSVSIMSRTSGKVITGINTDEKGNFELGNIPESKVRIKFSLVGYRSQVIDSVSLESTSRLGLIRLEPTAIEMGEVVIKSLKPMVEIHADRQVLNVDRMPGGSGSVTEVLKNSGLVDVEPSTNSITVRGENVKIKMDGHESNASGDMLAQMPASLLDQVEIVLAPGAKESAEGGMYILNLITKKNKIDNYNGSISLSGYSNNRSFGGTSLNYKVNKLNLFSDFYFGYYEFQNENESERYVYNSPNMYYTNTRGSNSNYAHYIYLNAGMDYDFDDMNSITVYGSYNVYDYKNSSNNNTLVNNSSNIFQYDYNRDYLMDSPSSDLSLYGFYKKKFGNDGNELTFDAMYTMLTTDPTREMILDYSYKPNLPQMQNSLTNTDAKTFIFKTDYVLPFNTDRLGAGYSFTHRTRKNDYEVKDYSYMNSDWRDSLKLSNVFEYNENINALYLTYAYKLEKFDVKLGLRGENLNTEGNQVTQQIDFHENYFSLFPTINVGYKISDMLQLGFNAFRRVIYPQVYYLNPFRQFTGPNTFYAGNPKLDPSYTTSFAFNLSQYVNVYYNKATGIYTSAIATENDSIIISSYINLNSSETYGFDLTFPYYNSPMMPIHLPDFITMLNVTFNYIYKKQDGVYLNEDLSMTDKTYSIRASLGFKLWWDINANLSAYYKPEINNKLMRTSEFKSLQLYLSKTFMDKKLRVSIIGSDLLNSMKTENQSIGANLYTRSSFTPLYSRGIGISVSYMFNDFKERNDRKVNDGRDGGNNGGGGM